MNTSSRLFNCLRCHRQVMICRSCDRGHIYCGNTCSRQSRQASVKSSRERYQKSFKGKLNNAKRQQRFRTRQKEKVTHHTSQETRHASSSMQLKKTRRVKSNVTDGKHCHFCGESLSGFFRRFFSRHPAGSRRRLKHRSPRGP
jgi:hypothetical protein